MRAPVLTSAIQAVATALAAAVTLAACGSVTTPPATGADSPPGGTPPAVTTRPASGNPGPPAGSRAEAAALARLLLSRLILPPGATRLPQTALPPSLTGTAFAGADVTPSLDQYQLFALRQPMGAAAAFLAAHVPAGTAQGGTGSGSGPGGVTMQDVTYLAQHVPAGIAGAQLVLTVVPASSGGSLLRADAQIIWYPPRTAAEYIDPDRYHVLSITVSVYGRRPHTVHKVVTSRAFIARLAAALNRMQAEPLGVIACPAIFADYRLSFSVSRSSRPVVVVSANETGCGGASITVNGHQQPPLADRGTIAALADQVVTVTWQL
jgi:hypothetical protein